MIQSVRKLLEANLFLELFIRFYTKVMIAWYNSFASTSNNYRVFTVGGKTKLSENCLLDIYKLNCKNESTHIKKIIQLLTDCNLYS